MSSLIPGLPEEIVNDHIMPKVLEPTKKEYCEGSGELDRDYLRFRFFNLLCIYKYMGVNKDWRRQFSVGEVYNALRLALWDTDIEFGHKFRGVRGTIELHKCLIAYQRNLRVFSNTHRISIPIGWEIQHAHLNNLWVMELEYLRNRLLDNIEYWSKVDGRSADNRRCINYWICPSERLLT